MCMKWVPLLHGNGGKFLKDSEHDAPYGNAEDDVTPRKILNEASPNEAANKRHRATEPMNMVCGDRRSTNADDEDHEYTAENETLDTNYKDENETLRRTIEEKDQEIKKLKASISNQISGFEKKLKYPFSLTTRTQREELQVVHEALTSLRKCFPANDPYQHTLDTIEQSLSALLERVNSLEIGAVSPRLSHKDPESVTVPTPVHRTNFLSSADGIRRPIPKISNFSVQRQEEMKKCTKVVYYMDKSVTPFRCVLNKRIGEATLRDFKLLFDRPGQYRYHFKTLDPEFGMVKEEVLHDDDILPGWDGKIIAWIEDDCS